MSSDIKGVVERHFKTWSTGDIDGALACFSEDGVFEDLAVQESYTGKAEMRAFGDAVLNAFPDFVWTPKTMVAEGSIVTTEWHMTGTHKGDFPGMPASGKTFSIPGMTIDEIKDGLIHRHRDYWSLATMLQQLGFMPTT
jgi:steroid delta-isomerase-like uncharacterized protein